MGTLKSSHGSIDNQVVTKLYENKNDNIIFSLRKKITLKDNIYIPYHVQIKVEISKNN